MRETSLGEDVIFCKLIRDGALRHLSPWKLSDLQRVLEMRCFEGLLSDEDLKEVYFQRMWGFKEKQFVLAGWRKMSMGNMKDKIRWSLRDVLECTPGMRDHLMALGTKEEIMREYGALAYVPPGIAKNAMCGVWALRRVRGVGLENLGGLEFEERRRCFSADCILLHFMSHTVISRHPASTNSLSSKPHILWKYTSFRSSSDSNPLKHRISSTHCKSLGFHGFKCLRIPSRINLQKITSSPKLVSRIAALSLCLFCLA